MVPAPSSSTSSFQRLLVRAAVLRQGAIALAGMLGLAVAKAFGVWLLARTLGPEVQGGFTLALTGMSLGAILFNLGQEYAGSFVAGRHPERVGAVAANLLVLVGVAALLSPLWGIVYTWMFPLAAYGYEAAPLAGALLIGLGTVLLALNDGLRAVAVGEQRFGLVAGANVLWGGVWAAGAFVAVSTGARGVLVAWAVSAAVGASVFLADHLRRHPRALRPDAAVFRQQLAYGARTLPGSLARALNMRIALYAIAFLLPAAQVGIYGVLLNVAELYLYVPTALGQVMLGAAAARRADAGGNRLAYVFVGGIGLLSAFVALVAGRALLAFVFGPAYGVGGGALAVLLLATTVHAVGLMRLHELLGAGDPAAATLAQLVTLAFSVAGTFLLVPRFGLGGAATATLLAYGAFTVYVFGFRRLPESAAP